MELHDLELPVRTGPAILSRSQWTAFLPRLLTLRENLLPPQNLLRVGNHRHHDAIRPYVDPGRRLLAQGLGQASRGSVRCRQGVWRDLAVRGLKRRFQRAGLVLLQNPPALGLQQQADLLRSQCDLCRPLQNVGHSLEAPLPVIHSGDHLADADGDGLMVGVDQIIHGCEASSGLRTPPPSPEGDISQDRDGRVILATVVLTALSCRGVRWRGEAASAASIFCCSAF